MGHTCKISQPCVSLFPSLLLETFTSQSSDLTLCRVVLRTEISSRDRGKQRDSSSPDPPVRFLQLSLNDLEIRDKKGCTVNIAVQGGGGGGGDNNGSGLPNLKDMGPKEINVHADQLGLVYDTHTHTHTHTHTWCVCNYAYTPTQMSHAYTKQLR